MNIDIILKKVNQIHKNKNEFYYFLLNRTRKRKLKKDYIFDELIKYIKEYSEIKNEIYQKYRLLTNENKKLFLNEIRNIISYKRLMNLNKDEERIPTVKKFNKYILLLNIINKYIDLENKCNNKHLMNASITLGYPPNWLSLLKKRQKDIFIKYFCGCINIDCYVNNYNRMLNDFYDYENILDEFKSLKPKYRKIINKKFKTVYPKYDVYRLYRLKDCNIGFSFRLFNKFLLLKKLIEEYKNEQNNK